MNSKQEQLKCFQVLQDERREDIISILLEDIDSIIFHLEEQDTIRQNCEEGESKLLTVLL